MNIKQAFLNSKKQLKEIEIKEFEITAYIGKWSGKDRARMLERVGNIDKLEESKNYGEMVNHMATVVQESLKDAEGNRVFTDSTEDFDLLMEVDGDVIQDIFEEIMDYNRLGKQEVVEASKN